MLKSLKEDISNLRYKPYANELAELIFTTSYRMWFYAMIGSITLKVHNAIIFDVAHTLNTSKYGWKTLTIAPLFYTLFKVNINICGFWLSIMIVILHKQLLSRKNSCLNYISNVFQNQLLMNSKLELEADNKRRLTCTNWRLFLANYGNTFVFLVRHASSILKFTWRLWAVSFETYPKIEIQMLIYAMYINSKTNVIICTT